MDVPFMIPQHWLSLPFVIIKRIELSGENCYYATMFFWNAQSIKH